MAKIEKLMDESEPEVVMTGDLYIYNDALCMILYENIGRKYSLINLENGLPWSEYHKSMTELLDTTGAKRAIDTYTISNN